MAKSFMVVEQRRFSSCIISSAFYQFQLFTRYFCTVFEIIKKFAWGIFFFSKAKFLLGMYIEAFEAIRDEFDFVKSVLPPANEFTSIFMTRFGIKTLPLPTFQRTFFFNQLYFCFVPVFGILMFRCHFS
jgi:hypothetical protein